MKILIVYYSRTGTTKKVAEKLRVKLEADIIELKTPGRYNLGSIGYMQAGKDATFKKTCVLAGIGCSLSDYDLVVVGTPIWSWNVSPPARTFCREQKDKLKQVAFFSTMGGSGDDTAFASMQSECGKEPIATLGLFTKEVVKDMVDEKIGKFVSEIVNRGS